MDNVFITPLIAVGQFIKTQLNTAYSWDVNTVIKVDKDSLVIPYIDEYSVAALLKNDILRCRFNIGEHEITFKCIVKDISFEALPIMNLKVIKVQIWKNIRDSLRYDVNYIGRMGFGNNSESVVIITNLSESGAAIVCDEQIQVNSNIRLSIFAFDKAFINLFAVLARSRTTVDGKIEYGVRFVNITEDEKQKIKMVIAQVRMKEEDVFMKCCKNYRITPRMPDTNMDIPSDL